MLQPPHNLAGYFQHLRVLVRVLSQTEKSPQVLIPGGLLEAPIGIEPMNGRFAVCFYVCTFCHVKQSNDAIIGFSQRS